MVAALRFALALSLALLACSGSNEPAGTGPVVDDVGSVVKVQTQPVELRVVFSFHDPDGDTITQYSFVPRGEPPVWRDLPSDARGSEGNEVEIVTQHDRNDLPSGPYAFDLMLRDDRGRVGRPHLVAFTVTE